MEPSRVVKEQDKDQGPRQHASKILQHAVLKLASHDKSRTIPEIPQATINPAPDHGFGIEVLSDRDATATAEVKAIRAATAHIGSPLACSRLGPLKWLHCEGFSRLLLGVLSFRGQFSGCHLMHPASFPTPFSYFCWMCCRGRVLRTSSFLKLCLTWMTSLSSPASVELLYIQPAKRGTYREPRLQWGHPSTKV